MDVTGDSANGYSSTRTHESAQLAVDATHSDCTLVESDDVATPAGTSVSESLRYVTITIPEDPESVAHPTLLQYVEEDGTAYDVPANGHMTYPLYSIGEPVAMYTPSLNQYCSSASTSDPYAQVTNSMGQLLSQDDGSYLMQPSTGEENPTYTLLSNSAAVRASPRTISAEAEVSDNGDAYLINGNSARVPKLQTQKLSLSQSNIEDAAPSAGSMTYANKISQATVQWLLENFETAEGASLPRSTIYGHYLRHCSEKKVDPTNTAGFGKIIHSVFSGLRARRLGTRGNSKYHYYGIRMKSSSPLIHLNDDGTSFEETTSASLTNGRVKLCNREHSETARETNGVTPNAASPQYHQYFGDASCAVPEFLDIVVQSSFRNGCTLEDFDSFRSVYREHCEAFLDAVLNFEFATIESLWREFWRSQDNNNGNDCEEEMYLSKAKLYQLCKYPEVQGLIKEVDCTFYQNLVEVLMPDVLKRIPSPLIQSIKSLAKGLESWLKSAMDGCPEEIVQKKLTAVSAFAQTLRRYTSLNDLAHQARVVLQDYDKINQMLADLNAVDFHGVQERVSLICECNYALVQRLEVDFKMTLLRQHYTMEHWADWLKEVVMEVLQPHEGRQTYPKTARQFLLQWSFYSSMVIKDLTLRGANSFLPFYRIRMFLDEYVFYLIERKVANFMGTTPTAVMRDVKKCH